MKMMNEEEIFKVWSYSKLIVHIFLSQKLHTKPVFGKIIEANDTKICILSALVCISKDPAAVVIF